MLLLFSPFTERRLARHPRNRRGRREGTLVIHQMRPLLPPRATTRTAVEPCLLTLPREGGNTENLVADLAQGPDLKVHLTEGEEKQEQLPHQTIAQGKHGQLPRQTVAQGKHGQLPRQTTAQGKHGGREDITNPSQTNQEHPHQNTTSLGDKD